MYNSQWIEKYEKALERKKVIILYGNIYDYYYYDNQLISLDKLIYQNRIKRTFFTVSDLPDDDGNREYSAINTIKDLQNLEDNHFGIIYIKNINLLFGDDKDKPIHYFNEWIRSNEADRNTKLIIVCKTLSEDEIPRGIYCENENVEIIHINYPEQEIREEYIKSIILEEVENDFDRIRAYTKLTDKRTLKEIKSIFEKAASDNKSLTKYEPNAIINYYDFGEERSMWSQLSDEEVLTIGAKLKERVIGQDHAVGFVSKILVRAKLGLNSVHQTGVSNRPTGIFFFVGPSGVGKTELAKAITQRVFGTEDAFKRFDMSEYKEETSINKLIGSAPGYIGYEHGGQLVNWVRENPFTLILFDEVEKAHRSIWDIFLQILEDGRLTDNRGQTAYFKESILVFTSNIGNKEVLRNKNLNTNEDLHNVYYNAVRNYFINDLERVEILNRIGDNIIPFNRIDDENIYAQIIESKLDIVTKNILKQLDCKVSFDRKAVDWFVKEIKKTSKEFGARSVLHIIETNFTNDFALKYMKHRKARYTVTASEKGLIIE